MIKYNHTQFYVSLLDFNWYFKLCFIYSDLSNSITQSRWSVIGYKSFQVIPNSLILLFREFCASLDYHPIRDTDFLDPNSFNPQISVCVRKRPMNKKEIETKEIDIVSIPDRQKLFVHEPKLKVLKTSLIQATNIENEL